MRQIVPDVYLIEGLRISHIYVVVTGDRLILVDSATTNDADRIVQEIEQAGFAISDLEAVVITHAHSDHVGSLSELVRRSGAEVWAHRDEIPYVQKEQPMPAASLVMRLMFRLSNRRPSTQTAPVVNRALEDGEKIGTLQVIHTPGHTPGSICLYAPAHKLLFCGDAMFNVHPLTGRKGLRPAIRLPSCDMDQVYTSLHKLAEIEIEILCPGHGEPIVAGAGEQIRALIA